MCAACQTVWCGAAWCVVPWGCVGSGAVLCLGVGWGGEVAWRVALGLIKSLLWLPFGQEYSGIVTGLCGRAVCRVAWVLRRVVSCGVGVGGVLWGVL